ncbi:MAG: hypothetical protein Q7S68_05920, partial [Deltaproteobacteria bacterium]|nr:hypothetical protein [Deltaproteobacteria bacterium]
SESGYMLLVDLNERSTIEQTPHCIVRLATSTANPSAHAPTVARQIIAAHPSRGFIFASGVIDYHEISTRLPKPDMKFGNAWVYMNAEVESNGMEAAVRVDRTKGFKAFSFGRIGGGVLDAAFCGYDIYDFFANVAFNREVSKGVKVAHGSSVAFSTGSFIAGVGEVIRKVPLGKFSFGLGSAAGMIYSALDVYKTHTRLENGETNRSEFHLALLGAGLTTLPTAVFGAGLLGVAASPLFMAAAGLATVGAMGLGVYRAVSL